jgi:geranylgeranyl diphosphate synthase type 3
VIDLLGVIFQIRDDYMNLWSEDYTTEKGLCEDLTEGKFSFPIIHAIQADATNHALLHILKQRTHDDDVKKLAVRYMRDAGSFLYCRQVLEVLMARARAEIEQINIKSGVADGKGMAKVLDKLDLDPVL